MRRRVLYTIKDITFGEFKVYGSANAWWIDQRKVSKLIDAFKQRHTLMSACSYTGISRDQYYHFLEVHPDFVRVKDACEQIPFIRALNAIHGDLNNPKTAKWYLSHTHPHFNRKLKQEDELIPTVPNKPEPDLSKIKAALHEAGEAFLKTEEEKKKQQEIVNSKEIAQHIGTMAYILSNGNPEEMAEVLNIFQEEVITNSGIFNAPVP